MKNDTSAAAIISVMLLFSCGDNQKNVKESSASPADSIETIDTIKTKQKESANAGKQKEETHVQLSSTEDQLINRIWQLPEVKALSDKIERESKGNRHLVGRISSAPSDDQEFYGISISEDNGEALATYFDFRIYPDNSIYYYDVVEDRELSLKEWRAQKK